MRKMISFLIIISIILSTVPFSLAESDPESLEVGDLVEFGHYEQDADSTDGSEAIQWLVLDIEGDQALLLSLYGLVLKPYHEKRESV